MSALVAFVMTLTLQAQGVSFEPEGTTLEEAAAKAKKENKLVFVDCFTQWCGPCRNMARNVFPQEKVGAFMNPRFVSITIDMESQYGAPLAKSWQVSAYPTFIIFNSDAQEVGRFVGGSDADGLIARVKEKSRDNGSAALEARWNAGERDEAFLLEYLKSLNASYKNTQANLVAEALLTGKEETFATDSVLSMIFVRSINNPFASAFVYTARHPEGLKAALGDMPVEMKIKSVLTNYTRQLINEKDGSVVFEQDKFEDYVKLLHDLNLPDAEHYRLSVLMALAEKQKDYAAYTKLVNEYLACPALDADDMTLARWAKPFANPEVGKADKKGFVKVLKKRVAELESGKRQPQTRMGNMMLSRPTDDLLRTLIDVLENGQPKQQ